MYYRGRAKPNPSEVLQVIDAAGPLVDTLGGKHQAAAREAQARAALAQADVERLRIIQAGGYVPPLQPSINPWLVVGAVAAGGLLVWALTKR